MGQKEVFLGGYHSRVGFSTAVRGHQRDMCAVCMRDDVFRILFILALEPLKMVKKQIFLGGQWTLLMGRALTLQRVIIDLYRA